jgi:alkylated DNA repair dioxygenase AlkB
MTGFRAMTYQANQADFFGVKSALPAGFRYEPEAISADQERQLSEQFAALPFKEFEFHGFLGKRRTISYGWRYDFNGGRLQRDDNMPPFLLPVREVAARFAGLNPADLQQALLIEYPPGAQIGWHKDRPVFDTVVGISLQSPCTFRLRRREGNKWQRASLIAEPRSAYVMKGVARTEWEHSIPPVAARRYSITFRNFKDVSARLGLVQLGGLEPPTS